MLLSSQKYAIKSSAYPRNAYMIGELIHHEIVVKYGIKSFAYPRNASMIGELIHHEIVTTNFTKKL